MQKLIARMKSEYEASPFKKPTLTLLVNSSSTSEAYELTYSAQKLLLKAEGEGGALLGLHHLLCVKEKWPEFLGKQQPKIPLRALWIEGDESGFLGESVFCSYPKIALKDPLEFMYSLYKKGFNRVVFGGKQKTSQIPFPKLPFPVILKPTFSDEQVSCSPLDERHAERMRPFKNILLESLSTRPSFFDHPKTKDFTKKELLTKEAHLASSCFYYVKNPELSLLDELEKGVSCVVEKSASLIDEIQKEPYPSQTPLVGLLNFESEKADLTLFSRKLRVPLIGMIVKIPKECDEIMERELIASTMMACVGKDVNWIKELLLY